MDQTRDYRVECVRDGLTRGWQFTPLNGKKPVQKGWTTADPADQETTLGWAFDGNVGLRTGQVSGIVVLDEDRLGAAEQFLGVLPETATVITGSGKRHYYYRAPDYKVKNSAGKLAEGLDIRGDGGQVVFPGSIHPETGEPYEWLEGRSPMDIPIAAIPKEIEAVLTNGKQKRSDEAPEQKWSAYASKALIQEAETVRKAEKGTRNDTLNKAAYNLGQLVGAGEISEEMVRQYLSRAAAEAGMTDEEDGVTATITSGIESGKQNPRSQDSRGRPLQVIEKGDEVDGGGDRSVPVEEVTDIRSNDYIPVPGQHVTKDGIIEQGTSQFATEVFDKIPQGSVYRFFGTGVEIEGEPGDREPLRLTPVGAQVIVDAYCKCCRWVELPRGRVRRDYVPCTDGNLIATMAGRHQAIPELKQVCSYPVFYGEEFELQRPGYNEKTKIYYDEPDALFDLEVIRDETVIREVLEDLVVDFPFLDEASRENFYGLLLTCLLSMCVGNRPLHAAVASKERTGKSLLMGTVAGNLILGKDTPMSQVAESNEEWQKTLFSNLLAGKTLICFDNISQIVDSGHLASSLTAEFVDARVLGASEIKTCANTLIVTATGNNVQGSGEICKRTVPVILQSRVENPEDRKDFKHKKLKDYVRSIRKKVMGCLIGMVENWKADGMPEGEMTLGGFDTWAATIGGVMTRHGFDKWFTNHKTWVRSADPDLADLEALYKAIVAKHGERSFVTTKEIITICEDSGIFPSYLRGSTDASKLTSISRNVLRRHLDAPTAGYILRRQGDDSMRRYYLDPIPKDQG